MFVDDSERTDGSYSIDDSGPTLGTINQLSLEEKARLTTWLVDQRRQGHDCPAIDENVLEYIRNKPPLPAHERADTLLRLIAERTAVVGTPFDIRSGLDPALYAWSESISEGEIGYLIDYLLNKGWLDANSKTVLIRLGEYMIPAIFRVTVEGRGLIADQLAKADSSQAFVAMWFDESMKEASTYGIALAISDAGYFPMRIDEKLDVRKIDDEIVAQIRRSRFVVADFTHGETKARGSVYWEAGFAYGLGIEVIYTCRRDMADDLPFDTRQYSHILWETPEDLRSQLRDRILARIGQGPGI